MEKFSIGANLKCPAARRNEGERLDALAKFENFGRQTDGLGRVVSNHAVFDRYLGFHPQLLSLKVTDAVNAGQECASSVIARSLALARDDKLPIARRSGRLGSGFTAGPE